MNVSEKLNALRALGALGASAAQGLTEASLVAQNLNESAESLARNVDLTIIKDQFAAAEVAREQTSIIFTQLSGAITGTRNKLVPKGKNKDKDEIELNRLLKALEKIAIRANNHQKETGSYEKIERFFTRTVRAIEKTERHITEHWKA